MSQDPILFTSMFLSLLPPPDPRTFLSRSELRRYYNELLQYHQRNADLLHQIVNGESLTLSATDAAEESMQSRDVTVTSERASEERTKFLHNGDSFKKDDSFKNGNSFKNRNSQKPEPAILHTLPQRKTASKKRSSLPANQSRAPQTEKLLVPNNLGASILAVMQQDPDVEYTSDDILKALNPTLPYGEARLKALSRYADRLGTLEKKGDIVRVTKGKYKLASNE